MGDDYFAEDGLDEEKEYDPGDDAKSCGCADDERCPLCCPNSMYEPGTEECDWCPYSEECEKDYEEWCKQQIARTSTNKAGR